MKLLYKILLVMSVGFGKLSYADEHSDLASLLKPILSLEANFIQKIRSEQNRLLQQSSGKAWLKKPAQFRWEVQGNEQRLIVCDGHKIWDFDKDLDQVTVQKINQTQTSAPIFFLTGDTSTLARDFKISLLPLKNNVCLSGSDACFELKPKKDEGSFQWIRIGFKNKMIKEMQLLDQLGQKTELIFKEVKLNSSIPSSKFTFISPKGVDILQND